MTNDVEAIEWFMSRPESFRRALNNEVHRIHSNLQDRVAISRIQMRLIHKAMRKKEPDTIEVRGESVEVHSPCELNFETGMFETVVKTKAGLRKAVSVTKTGPWDFAKRNYGVAPVAGLDIHDRRPDPAPSATRKNTVRLNQARRAITQR